MYLTSYVSSPSPHHFISSSSFSLSYPSNPLFLILLSSFLSSPSSLRIFLITVSQLSSPSFPSSSIPSSPHPFRVLSSISSSSSSSQFLNYPPHPSHLPLFIIHSILSVPSLLYFHRLPLFLILPMLSSSSSQSSSLSAPFSYFLISSLPYLHHPSRPDIFYLTHLNISPFIIIIVSLTIFFLSQSSPHATFIPKFICITYHGFLSSFYPPFFLHSALYRQFCSLRPVLVPPVSRLDYA